MGFDYVKEKLDAESVPIPYPNRLKTRNCWRCGQDWFIHEMKRVGSRWICNLCYDRPYGEDEHKRGDYPTDE